MQNQTLGSIKYSLSEDSLKVQTTLKTVRTGSFSVAMVPTMLVCCRCYYTQTRTPSQREIHLIELYITFVFI